MDEGQVVTRAMSLEEAIDTFVDDGATVALEGFTHLIPHSAAHEIIRQERRDLHIARMTPDVLCDQLIGMNCVAKLSFSWGGNPGVGSLYRFRDAIEHEWPRPLVMDEHSHAAMTNRYVAGASRLPFAVLRAYQGGDLARYASETVQQISCPFTGEQLAAVAALNPDVGVVHAQQADRKGNVHLWGITGVQKEVVLASTHAIVTVEEIVEEIELRPHSVVLPSWVIDAVVLAPGGAHPSYALDYYERDNDFYVSWNDISRDRDRFGEWMERNVVQAGVPA